MPGSLVLVSVGNTRTRIANVEDESLQPSEVLSSSDPKAIAARITALANQSAGDPTAIIASVNPQASVALERELAGTGVRVLSFGKELQLPIATALEHPEKIGHDRLLDAIGAFARSKQACVVIDAGTAVTVDFVDGLGVFQGGAIAPGVQMMLDSLHDHTSQLPALRMTPDLLPVPDAEHEAGVPFGKDTAHAMAIGAVSAVRGLVRHLIDAYAEFYKAYPRVVATGGDAAMLFEHDPLVEIIVPDLTLVGMLEAIKTIEAMDAQDEDDEA